MIYSANLGVIAPTAFAAAFTMVICLFSRSVGRRLGLLDDPAGKAHSRHAALTPLVGGFAILTPLIFYCLIIGLVRDPAASPAYWQIAPRFAASVAVMMVLGMLDDRAHLSARLRLVVAAMTFTAVVSFHPAFQVKDFDLPLFATSLSVTLGWLGIPLTVLCLTSLANAVNMADGRNGLVIGMCLLWTLAFLSVAPHAYPVTTLMLFVSLIVGFIFNLRGRLFLGDGGTYGLATYFGLAAIWLYNEGAGELSEAQILCLFLVPVIDMARLVIMRLGRGVSPLAADHEHLHHYLDDWIGWRRGLPLYLALAAIPILIAFTNPAWGGEALAAGVAFYLAVLGLARRRVEAAQASGAA